MSYRIGFGFDIHQLEEDVDFWLGGIKIPYNKGAVGHSDADVLIHSICDALLGAANLGDIGKHFPDNSDKYKGIDSKILLKDVMLLIRNKGYQLGNLDSTICLEKPKLRPFIDEIQIVLASCMGVDRDLISIKATTSEKLGFVGKEQGVAAYSNVLITS